MVLTKDSDSVKSQYMPYEGRKRDPTILLHGSGKGRRRGKVLHKH
jgi:hypothetical protein